MNKKWTLFLLATFIYVSVNAQRIVALHSATNGTQFFNDNDPFESAYNAAVTGDTIYLPGGTMPAGFIINKKLYIYGAGHYPSATTATQPTILDGNVTFNNNASNSRLEGVNIDGDIRFYTNGIINNITIKRCKFDQLTATGSSTNHCQNNVFIENVIQRTSDVSNLRNSDFYNNIISQCYSLYDLNFINNIFLYSNTNYYTNVITSANNCLFKNNIFVQETDKVCGGTGSSTWSHNIFCSTSGSAELGDSPTLINNYYMNRADVFILQSGIVFDYSHDYHLQATAAANLGDDGTQTGVYGGYYPWKTESVPVIPHITSQNISNNSDASGNIHINVNVEAQDD